MQTEIPENLRPRSFTRAETQGLSVKGSGNESMFLETSLTEKATEYDAKISPNHRPSIPYDQDLQALCLHHVQYVDEDQEVNGVGAISFAIPERVLQRLSE